MRVRKTKEFTNTTYDLYQLSDVVKCYRIKRLCGISSTIFWWRPRLHQHVLYPLLVLKKLLAKPLKTWQHCLAVHPSEITLCRVLGSTTHGECVKSSCSLFIGLVDFSLHKHHPCPLASKSFAGIERRLIASRWTETILYSFFAAHEGNLFFLKTRVLVVDPCVDGIDILKDLFVVDDLRREQSAKFVPLEDLWVCFFISGDKDFFDVVAEGSDKFFLVHW